MSKPMPFKCPSPSCEFYKKIIWADILQIRFHLIMKHDYQDLQNMAILSGIIDSIVWRSHGWFVRKICEACIVKEIPQ